MREIDTFIKLYRKFTEWEWYSDISTSRLFLHLILTVNWTDKKWQGICIERGSRVASYQVLSTETGLSVKQVRTAIKKLQSTGEVAIKSTNKYSVFTVKNYDLYQAKGKQEAGERQAEDKQRATTKESKEVKKEKNKTICKADASELFERLWKLYPLKRGKGQISDAKKMRLLDIGYDEMERAINRYKADLARDDWRKPQNGSTFFNSGFLDYLDGNYEKPKAEHSTKDVKTQFHNFEEREYDYDELEKQLFEQQIGG